MSFRQLIISCIFLANGSSFLFAQINRSRPVPKPIREKVIFSTDRTIYFSGENILFTANRMLSNLNNDTVFSNILYLELYDQKDIPVVQKKEQLINGMGHGSIEIPADIITGNYYLRAYTQYMRNFNCELFYTSQLTIINPELPSKEDIRTIKCKKDTLVNLSDNRFEIITSKEVFSSRSLIAVDLKGKSDASISVSVVKKGSSEQERIGINGCFKPVSDSNDTSGVRWYPEIRSVSISGKVIDSKTGNPVKDVLVYASIVDNGKQFHVVRTKKGGEFILALPNLNEKNKIYVCPQKQTDKELGILINQDFSSDFPKYDYVPESMDSSKLSLINEMYVNYQVARNFNNSVENKKSFLDTLPDPFSDKYENVVLKDYVDLPEMMEVFNEIVPYTQAKKKGKDFSIQMFDKRTKVTYQKPLILFDGIPFQSDSALINLSPSKIVAVGVIAEPFVHGSEIINGIMSIRSADGNLGGLKLPGDLVVVDYITLSPLSSQQYKEHKNEMQDGQKIPDFRNTMYWNPSVVLKNGEATLQFYSADCASDYDIIIKGVDENGALIFAKKTIRIDAITQ